MQPLMFHSFKPPTCWGKRWDWENCTLLLPKVGAMSESPVLYSIVDRQGTVWLWGFVLTRKKIYWWTLIIVPEGRDQNEIRFAKPRASPRISNCRFTAILINTNMASSNVIQFLITVISGCVKSTQLPWLPTLAHIAHISCYSRTCEL
jgi:hypothetical protein